MKRVVIAGFQHETNTYAPMPTGYEEFTIGGSWPALTTGDQVIETFKELNIPIGGFIKASTDWQLLPVLWASAEPGGYVSSEAFDRISKMICDGIADSGSIDAVYLDLHGAMVVEDHEDGEGELLRRVRDVVGPDIPIAVSLDLHGNLFPQFFELADVVTIYRTYPHIDMAETGQRCHALLSERLSYGPLAKSFRQLDYLVPLTTQSTMREPARTVYATLETADQHDVLSADIALGFPPADIEHCGVSLLCYGKNQAACDSYADLLFDELQRSESAFVDPMVPAVEAVENAMRIVKNSAKPVVIADPQDNPGAGGSGDTTGLLRALIACEAQDVWVGMIWDPEAAASAHRVGVGGEFVATLGGRFADSNPENAPLEASVIVESIKEGNFTFTGPMYGGADAVLGKMALLKLHNTDIHVIVSSIRTQNADAEIFRYMGVDPEGGKILVVKSTVHFLADYTPLAEEILFAKALGLNACVVEEIQYENLRDGVRLGACGPVFNRPA